MKRTVNQSLRALHTLRLQEGNEKYQILLFNLYLRMELKFSPPHQKNPKMNPKVGGGRQKGRLLTCNIFFILWFLIQEDE